MYPLGHTEKYKEVVRGSGAVIKHSPHYPRVEGFTPAASTGIENNDEREGKTCFDVDFRRA